jgi:hypothetical protein
LTVGVGLLAGLAIPAGAANDPAKGQDGKPDAVFLGGSDTTFEVETRLSTLYNQAPGCHVNDGKTLPADSKYYPINQVTAGNLTSCKALDGDSHLNADHDTIVQIYPTGSSAGINVVDGANGAGLWQGARSSRSLTTAEKSTVTHPLDGEAFARDGVAVETFGAKVPEAAGFTQAQLQNIYSCNGSHNGVNGTTGLYSYHDLFPSDPDATLIYPYGIQTASGTYATFKTYLATVDPSPATGTGINCVQALNKANPNTTSDGTDYAFENDAKPVVADANAKGIPLSGVLWWSSYGVQSTYSYKRDGANFWTVDGVSPQLSTFADKTYNIWRDLWKVQPKTTLDAVLASNAKNAVLVTTGASDKQDGALRSYTEFVCEPSSYYTGGAATLNPYNGDDYFTDITSAIAAEGFQREPGLGTQRNFGACFLDR